MSTPLPMPGAALGAFVETRRNWLGAGLALLVALTLLAVVYWPEIAAAGSVWLASTAYNHCFLVLPITAYLLYARWEAVAAAVPQPAPLIALTALLVALAWFVAERAGIMEARQLLAMTVFQILCLAALGPRAWRAVAAPLLYLYFLVPVGEFLVPWLQQFTVAFIRLGLDVLRVPHFVDGITIEIPEGRFFVADACAGLRFLIASAAFGVFYACLTYTSPLRRLLFIALSLIVPVIANGCRALGIVYLGHLLGSAEAAGIDHVLYGWLFFAIVTLLLIAAGLPFRQSPAKASSSPPLRPFSAPAAAAALAIVAVLAAAPRLAAARLDRAAETSSTAAALHLPLPAGCIAASAAGVAPRPTAAGALAVAAQDLRCGGDAIALRFAVFPPHVGAAPVFAAVRGATIVAGWDLVATEPRADVDRDTGERWQVTELERHGQFIAVATAMRIDGRPSAGGVASRLRQAWSAVERDPAPPVVATVAADEPGPPGRARVAIERLLDRTHGLSAMISAAGASARR